MFQKVTLALTVVALVSSSAATTVLAQQLAQATRPQQQACTRDVSRHCRSVMNAGDMAVFQCLKANRPKLSAACGQVIDQH